MGYGFYMTIDAGGEHPALVKDGLSDTYNVSPMYHLAFSSEDGIRCIHQKSGMEALPLLEGALKRFKDDPDTFKAMNPPNGWGSYELSLGCLSELIRWAKECPKAVFEVL